MKYEREFTLTSTLIKALRSRGYSLVCARQGCNTAFKVDDRVVSIGGRGVNRKHFHKLCRELQRSPKWKFIILDECDLTEDSMREFERVIKTRLRAVV